MGGVTWEESYGALGEESYKPGEECVSRHWQYLHRIIQDLVRCRLRVQSRSFLHGPDMVISSLEGTLRLITRTT